MTKSIGRRKDADLIIPPDNLKVSGQHLVAEKRGNDVFIMDVGSKNGTTLNGQRLIQNQWYKVTAADRIVLGNQYQLQWQQLQQLFNSHPRPAAQPAPAYVPPPQPVESPISAPKDSPFDTGYEYQYGGFWVRVMAYILDYFLVMLPMGFVWGIFALISTGGAAAAFFPIITQIYGFIATWLYFALMESSHHQATLGKKLMNLKVVDTEFRQISFGRATGRYFAKYISILILGIGYIMAAFHSEKRALHDMIAGTCVLKTAKKLR